MHTRFTTEVAALALAVLCPVSGLACQSHNVQLLGSLSPAQPTSIYSDLWGYYDALTGKEYCLLCSEEGTHVIDCSDPTNPVQRALIPTEQSGSGNTWRDIKTFGTYAYVISEAYAGMQIIDLSNPDNPVKVTTWGTGLWTHAHNLGMDVDTGTAYVCGTDNGTPVLDVATNPTNPTWIFRAPRAHALSAARGYGYFANGRANALSIYDTTQLPAALPLVGTGLINAGVHAHSCWPTRDDNFCVFANEDRGGPVTVWDVSFKRLPMKVASFTAGDPSAFPHDPYVKDRVVHFSYYTEGYRAWDLTDPRNPIEVGYYDTYSGPSGSFSGAWGVFPAQPSGVIYISDIQQGLLIFKSAAASARYGATTIGSAGSTPEIHAFGAPYLGNSRFKIEASHAAASRPGALLIGSGRAQVMVGGLTINVSLAVQPVVASTSSDTAGNASVATPLPNNQMLLGAPINAQFFFLDSAADFDFSGTQGLEFEAFVK